MVKFTTEGSTVKATFEGAPAAVAVRATGIVTAAEHTTLPSSRMIWKGAWTVAFATRPVSSAGAFAIVTV
jgi:hypothetical protein